MSFALMPMMLSFLPALTFLASVAVAATDEPALSCPSSITVMQEASEKSNTWESMDTRQGQPHRLRAASFYSGHPKNLRELKPSHIDAPARGTNEPLVHTYKFSEPYADGVWLACLYELTSVVAFKRLPTVPASCVIRHTRKPSSDPVLTIRCR